MRKFHLVIALLAISTPLQAQNVTDTTSYAYLMSLPVPVVEGDILDKPYRVIGHIDKGVRKATVFSKPASHDKVMRELWEKGRKMGADAVINAGYGEAHKVAFSSWGTREARGTAIKFLTDAEIAKLKPKPAPEPAEPARAVEPSNVTYLPAAQQDGGYSVAAELAKLVEMRDRGLISDEIYEQARQELLDRK